MSAMDSVQPAERERIGATVDVDAVLRRLEDAAPAAPNGRLLALAAIAIRSLRRQPAAESEGVAFVRGAKWWEFESTGATMWQSDQNKAAQEASRRYGVPVPDIVRGAESAAIQAALRAPTEREPAASPVPDSDVRALIAEIRDGFSQDELRERTCQTLVQLAAERGLWRAEIRRRRGW